MKTITNGTLAEFKNAIKQNGREIDSVVTYTINGTTYTLGNEELNAVTPHYNGDILKSIMKQLDIDSNVDIPIGTEVTYQFGVKARYNNVLDYRDNYDYISFGNYVVYSSQKKEDTNSYQIVCYDKMLNAMVDYKTPTQNGTPITYPKSIRNYLEAICETIGLTYGNVGYTYPNSTQQITSELFLDEDGKSLDYTFRDVLDYIAQVTASTIIVEGNTLKVKYVDGDYTDYYKFKPVSSITGSSTINTGVSITQNSNFSLTFKINGLGGTKIIINGSNGYNIAISNSAIYLRNGQQVLTQHNMIFATGETYTIRRTSNYVYVDNRQIGMFRYPLQNANLFGSIDVTITNVLLNNYNYQLVYNTDNNKVGLIQARTFIETDYTATIPEPPTIETIDEEFLKDTNINFGELFGEINTITFKRSADADVYSVSFPSNLSDNLKNEIVISENPFLNNSNRNSYALPILYKLYGIQYSTYDFQSTGIGYLDFLDKYNVVINETTYPCIMFNNEFQVTQGLQENIFAEKPNGSKTDYNTASKDEREDLRAEIIVDKKIGEVDIRGKTINLTSDVINIASTNFSVDTNGNITANGGTIAGYHITSNELYAESYAPRNYTQSDLDRARAIWRGEITPTSEDLEKYDFDGSGTIDSYDVLRLSKYVNYGITTTNPLRIVMSTGDNLIDSAFKLMDGNGNEFVKLDIHGVAIDGHYIQTPYVAGETFAVGDSNDETIGYIVCGHITSSSAELKVSIPVDGMIDANSVSIVSVIAKVRGNKGYLDSNSNFRDLTSWCSAQIVGNNITLTIRKSSGTWSNVDNNTPIALVGYFEFEFN